MTHDELEHLALQTFTWDPAPGTRHKRYYDITMALNYIEVRPPALAKHLAVPVAPHFAQILSGRVGVTWSHVPTVDPNQPGLAGVVDGGVLLLDGWHRLCAAHARGWATMTEILLDADETEMICFDMRDEAARFEHYMAAVLAAQERGVRHGHL